MRLLEVHLVSTDLAAQKEFYREVLGLPVVEAPGKPLEVRIGPTRLSFLAAEHQAGPYHLALDVPEDRFADAAEWIRARVPLLKENGHDTFTSEDWNAEMLYFTDPCGNILELIARHTRFSGGAPLENREDFGASQLLNVSEVGVAVPDVQSTLALLQSTVCAEVYREGSVTFTAAGTHDGLLIVVRQGRPWFPTTRAAEPLPTRILAQTTRAGQLTLPAGPVQIIGVASP